MIPPGPHLKPCGPKLQCSRSSCLQCPWNQAKLGSVLQRKDGAASVRGVLQLPTGAAAQGDPLALPGISVVAYGAPQGRIRASPCRAMVEGPAKQVSRHEPEQPPLAGVSLRAKGEGSRICSLFFISVCAAHAEFEASWTNALPVNKELNRQL